MAVKEQGTSFMSNEHMLWPRPKLWCTLSPKMDISPIPSDVFQLVVCLLLDDTLVIKSPLKTLSFTIYFSVAALSGLISLLLLIHWLLHLFPIKNLGSVYLL